MGKLEGKIALITGGNAGIGFARAKRFVTEGARYQEFLPDHEEPPVKFMGRWLRMSLDF